MHPVAEESTLWTPSTEAEKEMVREQMNRLLETSHFKNSKRYPALFRFIVEETLEGRGEYLKERLLGVRVFDRPADYDTAADPIVRVTIAEIRKRIAQYYHEDAHESEMRIELLPGHYEPEFRPRRDLGADRHRLHLDSASHRTAGSEELQPEALKAVAEPQQKAEAPPWTGKKRKWMIAVVAACVCAAAFYGWRWTHPSALNEFWAPILGSNATVIFCLPNGAGKNPGMAAIVPDTTATDGGSGQPSSWQTFLDHESLGENVVFSDVLAALKISNFLATRNRDSRFRLNVSTTLDDLRQGPVVLIGGMDNQWTLRAIANLRYHFSGNDQETFWISDNKNPGNKNWALALDTHYSKVNHDYAIIARIHDDATGEPEVIAAGIGMSGTAAAGAFLVDPVQLAELRKKIGPGFKNNDFEAVLSTDVVDGIAGTPKIVAVSVW
jgi:hypothetical protein